MCVIFTKKSRNYLNLFKITKKVILTNLLNILSMRIANCKLRTHPQICVFKEVKIIKIQIDYNQNILQLELLHLLEIFFYIQLIKQYRANGTLCIKAYDTTAVKSQGRPILMGFTFGEAQAPTLFYILGSHCLLLQVYLPISD